MKHPLTLRILTGIYSLLIIIAALIPTNTETSSLNTTFILNFRLDYLVHLSIYIPLMILVHFTFKISFRSEIRTALIWILICLAFSWLTEAIQLFVPYRSFNINDLAANSLGVLLGALFFLLPLKNIKT